ncbi:magnesium/cobalt transporter CorA [Gynurincola endophyticus]|uniref:magnesium/cobalt transporter CorA n=1 Tax=Gynurincola endophyticus TaxID=2479004 RepID=UPI000F8CF7A4|nr:magnesium/cobalt transporter CorA [Gynurincola endophyticus]
MSTSVHPFNPLHPVSREDDAQVKYHLIKYNSTEYSHQVFTELPPVLTPIDNNYKLWIHVEGIHHTDVIQLCEFYGIHSLLIEDILSSDQRPKMDDAEGVLFFLLYSLKLSDTYQHIRKSQITIAMTRNYIISFEEKKAVSSFQNLFLKLENKAHKSRIKDIDYLLYNLLDHIVDHYYVPLEKMGEVLENIEGEIMGRTNQKSLAKVNLFRKEILLMKKHVLPIKEIINTILRSDNKYISEKTKKYFKDILDHVAQAGDTLDNYRDVMMSLQELYINKLNMRLNEVMKVMAIVTCLMAPATVISGIFGMNFERIPGLNHAYGFYITISLMLIIPIIMLFIFKKRNWF